MRFNPEKHHRHSIRLKNYDYASQGYYFVTACVKNRELLFEPVFVQEMIEKWWLRIPERFLGVLVDEYVIMPNHFHGIIVIMSKNVGVSQRGYLKSQCGYPNIDDDKKGRPHRVAPTKSQRGNLKTNDVGVSQGGYPKSQRGYPNIDDDKKGRPHRVAPTKSHLVAPTKSFFSIFCFF